VREVAVVEEAEILDSFDSDNTEEEFAAVVAVANFEFGVVVEEVQIEVEYSTKVVDILILVAVS
jgi:hypothetical protein